jgi:hypothetical protein
MYMHKQQQGMILLTTILILGLLAAMVFSMQRGLWLYAKLHQKTLAHHHALHQLEAVALKLGGDRLSTSKTSCSGEIVAHHTKYFYWIKPVKFHQKQWIISVQSEAYPTAMLLLRFSKTKGLMSWRYLID